MYTPDAYEIVAEVISVICVTIVSLLFGRKIASIERPLYYIRGLLLTLYSTMWTFDIITCMANSTNNGNYISCGVSIFNCIIVYTIVKIVLYLYFVEKIYIISVPKASRLRTPIYLIHLGLLVPYLALFVLQIIYRIQLVASEYPYHCTIGFQLPASVTTLAYDILLSLLYTGFFVKYAFFPSVAQQTAHQAVSLRIIAQRSIVATAMALVASAVNYCLLIGLDGQTRGLLETSVISVTGSLVVVSVHWVAMHPSEMQCTVKASQLSSAEKPMKLEIKQHQEVVVLSELAP
ncbi:hypothetical protein LRAMOSA04260 [Lichtheimia ramosa]|uniref:Uncharacterized protein n=1 Tax=Lichtheimia ramosa TaxID=688394 RepID=A0A077WXU1_9FUNG|nr:hypothetical protein LRAMOSA04260 [Lichtheimia ramosa]